MKDIILIGIDFSDTSNNALQYGVGLAKKMGADILLVWVDTTSADEDAETQHEKRLEAKHKLKALAADVEARNEGMSVHCKLRKGMVHRELAFVAKEFDARLMVIGTDGISGVEEFRIENNTFRIIAQSPCPVISVRQNYKVTGNINTLMLPIDEMKNTIDKLPLAIQLAKDIKAGIRLLNIYHPKIESLRNQTNAHSTKATKILETENVISDIDVPLHTSDPKQVVEAAVNSAVDMLVIMTNPVMSRADIPEGILAQKVIHFSPIPILSVQAKPI